MKFAVSTAGHDKGTYYAVIGEEADAVRVADGRLKTLEKPKRKNRKHVRLFEKNIEGEAVRNNADIIRMIREIKRKKDSDEEELHV
ncbi:MAG: KOW domain-containing RNA-binding protein [Lachnospiraceae bacterium]|nr:KOW domain-containing RNA-binding protein [Lachnospiraceae bacterium]